MGKQKTGFSYLIQLFSYWVAICLIHAAIIEVDPDEAYYWIYTKQLDWGYFDHPPGVALSIAIGSWLPDELGVRFGTLLLHFMGLYVLWVWMGKPNKRENIRYLLALTLAMPLLQIYGLIATPDGPLLFFTILFFYLYQQFTTKSSWWNTFALGICMAALLYSKYHGVLLIFFILLSNLSLLRNPKFYIASIFGAILFFPHLYWQYSNDFPSFRYHLKGRNDAYELKYTITYVLNQLVIFSPLLLPFWINSLRKSWSSNNLVIRACYFVCGGFWAFFFYSSFNGHVEPQWTAILSIPLIYLMYQHGLKNQNFRKWSYRMALVSFLLIVVARFLVMMTNPFNINSNFHKRDWIFEIKDQAKGKPVIFENSYRNAAKYTFYAKEDAHTFANHMYRKNQYDLWDYEAKLHGKDVLMVLHKHDRPEFYKNIRVNKRTFFLQELENFQIKEKVDFLSARSTPITGKVGQIVDLSFDLYNPYWHDINTFEGNAPLYLKGSIYQNAEYLKVEVPLEPKSKNILLPSRKQTRVEGQWMIPDLPKGEYDVYFGFGIGEGYPDQTLLEKLVIQ